MVYYLLKFIRKIAECVKIDARNSEFLNIHSCVPQSCILDFPIFFLIYTLNVISPLQSCNVYLHVDEI